MEDICVHDPGISGRVRHSEAGQVFIWGIQTGCSRDLGSSLLVSVEHGENGYSAVITESLIYVEEVIEHRCAELGSTEVEVWPLGVLYPYEVAAAFLHRGDGVENEEHVNKSEKWFSDIISNIPIALNRHLNMALY